ncbi:MAG: DUF1648 domain-containing protein [Actinomycetia bacterium]|nr:DUF1648 domain-containing protein [Actinomycetes bacterium]
MKALTPPLVLISFVPVAIMAVAVLCFLPDVVPLHVSVAGVIDGHGSKFVLLGLGGMLSAFNLLFTLMFHNAEKMMALGIVHGTSVRGARIILLACIIFFGLLPVICLLILVPPW